MGVLFLNKVDSRFTYEYLISNHKDKILNSAVTILTTQDFIAVDRYKLLESGCVKLYNPNKIQYGRGKYTLENLSALIEETIPKSNLIIIEDFTSILSYRDKGSHRLINLLMYLFNTGRELILTYDQTKFIDQWKLNLNCMYNNNERSSKKVINSLLREKVFGSTFEYFGTYLKPVMFYSHESFQSHLRNYDRGRSTRLVGELFTYMMTNNLLSSNGWDIFNVYDHYVSNRLPFSLRNELSRFASSYNLRIPIAILHLSKLSADIKLAKNFELSWNSDSGAYSLFDSYVTNYKYNPTSTTRLVQDYSSHVDIQTHSTTKAYVNSAYNFVAPSNLVTI